MNINLRINHQSLYYFIATPPIGSEIWFHIYDARRMLKIAFNLFFFTIKRLSINVWTVKKQIKELEEIRSGKGITINNDNTDIRIVIG